MDPMARSQHTRHVGNSFASAFVIFVVVALSGCHGPAKRIVGKWTIREFDKTVVEFKPDDSFVFTGALGGLNTHIAGNYAEVGNQLTLTATEIPVNSTDPQLQAIIDSGRDMKESQFKRPITEQIDWKSEDEFIMLATTGWLKIGNSSATFLRIN